MGKDCGSHKYWWERKSLLRSLLQLLLAVIILVAIIVFIIWLVLRPTKPRFYLQDASVQEFNLSRPENLLTSSFQVTVTARNPNDRIGIYYDRLNIFASYKYQQITLSYSLPPIYQGHNDIEVWSPIISGEDVPVAPYLCDALQQDEAAGFLMLYVKLDGRIRWKVGTWISGHYHLNVNCPAFLAFVNNAGGPPTVRFGQITSCSVDV